MFAALTLCATALLLSPPSDVDADADAKKPAVVAKAEKTDTNVEKKTDTKTDTKTDSDLRSIERNIIELTNAERTRRGLPALKLDTSLMKTSRHHASWMASRRKMVHSRLNLGENIAMGQRTSTLAVHAWMNSSGHRANILNRGYKKIGAAAFRTPSGTIYWCQQFRF
jgi:uncharacterized protein YkwD